MRLQPLRDYLRNNVTHLRSTPCLLIIPSAPPPPLIPPPSVTTSSVDRDQRRQFKRQAEKIHSFIQRNTHTLTLEHNLKTIPFHISSAFPTLANVEEAVSLARRAGLKGGGEGVVIGLGTGAAIDLAKAVADTLFTNNISPSHDDVEETTDDTVGGSLILSPCTLGGLWATSSNLPSILLDTKEEILLPHRTPTWRKMIGSKTPAIRKGTVVTIDPVRHWAMPPLYASFRPAKRSDYSTHLPPMAHVAAAALAILLDVARLVDVFGLGVGTSIDIDATKQLQHNMILGMKEVASSCASVLVLATHEANAERNEERIDLAQRYILDSIPRLSSVLEHLSLLSSNMPCIISTSGTIPQTLANALLPTYFPQCHYITYLASTLTGLCDMLSDNNPLSSLNGEESMVGAVTSSILESSNTINSTMQVSSRVSTPSLSSWATHVSVDAGLPSMASLAYGTPELHTLVNSLDSYAALMESESGHEVGRSRSSSMEDNYWVMEDILRRGLHR